MKYLLFAAPFFYPRGGWGDYQGEADENTVSDKLRELLQGKVGWWADAIDAQTNQRIYEAFTTHNGISITSITHKA